MAFGYFEFSPYTGKVRVLRDHTFPTIESALAHFGDKVVCHEIADDGMACDLFVNTGAVYAIELVGG